MTMDVMIYQADIYCAECGEAIREKLNCRGDRPEDRRENPNDWPQGPYSDGDGEADSPQHCAGCRVFLENPLTADGYAYVLDQLRPYVAPDDNGKPDWSTVADRAAEDGNPVKALWARYYQEAFKG